MDLDVVSAHGDIPTLEYRWTDSNDRLDCLKLLYDAFPINFDKFRSKDGILHRAAPYANEEEVVWLIKHGAGSSTCNEEGSLPLHIAAAGNYAAVHALVEHGNPRDLKTTDRAGWTPLHTAAFRGMAQWMKNPQLMIVHMSAEGYEGDYYRTLARWMDAGADITAQTLDDHSLTPYELARMLGPEEQACYLHALRELGKDVPSDADEELF